MVLRDQLASEDSFLEISDLYLNFNVYQGLVKVLDGIDLEMKKGEILGLVGETGCGKTVTVRSILSLLEANAIIEKGEINFLGSQNLLKFSEKELEDIRGLKISMIFQEPMTYLNPTMRIGDQVAEGLLLHFKEDMIKNGLELLEDKKPLLYSLYKNILQREINNPNSIVVKLASSIPFIKKYQRFPSIAAVNESIEILKDVGMPSPERIAKEYPHELSGGMRQRVLIAIAMACKPELIIADEPTTAVDVTTQAKILRLILNLMDKYGTSILVITHNLGIISEICDRVCVMYAGQVAEIGNVVDVFRHPLHPYTSGLMRAIHNIGDKNELEEIKGIVPILLKPPTGCRFHPRCSKVMDICSKEKPKNIEMHEGHIVSCWLYDKKDE
jgi:peptide/nickel transport system ATP-binding protein